MPEWAYGFLTGEEGQDLIEYSLLICFIAIACMMLVGSGRPAVKSIWATGNDQLNNAAETALGNS